MPQLVAVEKMLYYPTDVGEIIKFVEHHVTANCAIFTGYDPCSGEGLALRAFVNALLKKGKFSNYRTDVHLVGTELEEHRAEAGKANLDKSIHTAFESCRFIGHPDFIWMNPPYDDIGNKRAEIIWIDRVAPLLNSGRCMVLVLPRRFMHGYENYEDLRMCLSRNRLKLVEVGTSYPKKSVGAFKFSEPAFQQFKQYFLVVEKHHTTVDVYDIPIEGTVGECDTKFTIDMNFVATQYNSRYETKRSVFRVEVLNDEPLPTRITEDRFIKLFGEVDNEVPVIPLQPMIDEILAAVIAGGMFSGVRLGNSVVRGGIEKVIEKKTVEAFHKTETYETQVMKALISELDMTTGEIESYNSDGLRFGERIEQIAHVARDIMHEKSPSIYQEKDIERLSPKFAMVHAPKKIRGHANGLFPAQIREAAMVLRGWEQSKAVILLGKMGTGKTITSIAAAIGQVHPYGNNGNLSDKGPIQMPRKDDAQKIVILLPAKNDLVSKWKEEIALSCRDLKPKIFDVETISQVRKAFAEKGLCFILVKESMLKRTSGWDYINIEKKTMEFGEGDKKHKKEGRRRCWKCGHELELKDKNGNRSDKSTNNLYCGATIRKWDPQVKEYKPVQCCAKYTTDVRDQNIRKAENAEQYFMSRYGQVKWNSRVEREQALELLLEHRKTFAPKGAGNAYASLARYILKHYSKSYVLIMDEAHQFKGGDTARGYASASIIKGAWRVLAMTGTFYNGLASSMFYTLYRSQGSFREMYTYDGVEEYVEAFGLSEKKTTHYDSEQRSSYGYKKDPVSVKEIPGIHPSMIAQMLGYSTFMKIQDFGTPKFAKIEHTLFLPLPANAAGKIKTYLSKIKDQAIEDMKDKANRNMSLMSSLTQAKQAVYDVYPIGDRVARDNQFENDDRVDENGKNVKKGQRKIFTLEPIDPDIMTPKEEALLRINQLELARINKPILVYYLQTDRRPVHERLQKWYTKWGMKLEYMPSTVSDRIAFIKQSLRRGTNAILCNPNLVREGIDLLQFGAIVWYGMTDDAVLVDQANARIYRPLIQESEAHIYYLAYNETYQSERWDITAQKVAAMSAVHGDIRTGLASLLGEQSMIATVQDYLIKYEKKDSSLHMKDLPELEMYVPASPIDDFFNKDGGFYDWGMVPAAAPLPVDAKKDEIVNLDMFSMFNF